MVGELCKCLFFFFRFSEKEIESDVLLDIWMQEGECLFAIKQRIYHVLLDTVQ